MDVQGWVVVGLAVVLFGYLVPHLVQSRQQLAQARVDDRFSGSLRVVTTGATARQPASGEHHGTRESRPYLHGPRRRTEAPAVNRPTTPSERAATEARRVAAARAARAAGISRRRAAARRRLVLTLVLLLAGAGGWLGFGLAGMSVALGVVPTVLLGAVLVAGRRAAKISARRNAADRAAMARLDLRPTPRTRPSGTTAEPTRAGSGSHSAGVAGAGAAGESGTPAQAGSDQAGGAGSRDVGGHEAPATPADGPAVTGAAAGESGTSAADGPAGTRVAAGEPGTSATASEASATAGSADAGATARAAAGAAGDAREGSESGGAADSGAAGGVLGSEPGGVVGRDAAVDQPPGHRSAEWYGPTGTAPAPTADDQDDAWTPVPVPAPSYTLKAPAPRRDIAPYEASAESAVAAEPTVTSGLAGSPYAPVADPEPVAPQAPEARPTRGLDLDSVLARRRGA